MLTFPNRPVSVLVRLFDFCFVLIPDEYFRRRIEDRKGTGESLS